MRAALTAIILAAVLTFLAGCSKTDGEPQNTADYSFKLVYSENAPIPECRDGSPAYELLRYVTVAETVYYARINGAINFDPEAVKAALLRTKDRFAAAISLGLDMTADEFSSFESNVRDGLYYTYLTDAEKRAGFDSDHDQYSDDAFAFMLYGIYTDDYITVSYEETVASRYVSKLKEDAAGTVTDEQLYAFYLENKQEFDYVEADVIMTAKAPSDVENEIAAAQEFAVSVNSAEDPVKAFEEAAEAFPDSRAWAEDSGSATLMMNVQYTGLYGEIMRRFSEGQTGAYVIEFEGNVYIILASAGGGYSESELAGSDIRVKVRDMLSEEIAIASVPGLVTGLTGAYD